MHGLRLAVLSCLAIGLASTASCSTGRTTDEPMYLYTVMNDGTANAYDEALAVSCLQGIINRTGPRLYVLANHYGQPETWLKVMSTGGRWMEGRKTEEIKSLDGLRRLAADKVKGIVIWDPEVPASVNVATTIAGVEDAVALSPEYAEKYLKRWRLPVLKDLRGMFTGAETGSKKNDAYRWAIREYLAKGKCSSRLLCLYFDAQGHRSGGDIAYIVNRDRAVMHRAFVYDLSPWGDEKPGDDPVQPLGTDLATYKMLLDETLRQSAGKHMTEVAGFFDFFKYSNMPNHPSSHDPVPTEWETVYLISHYNCYQNTAIEFTYNQSFHCYAPMKPLKQNRPKVKTPLENKAYMTILMADYDSAYPLYDFLEKKWADKGRGQVPLAWGINPNLMEMYPDIIGNLYATATPNDYFVADASAAGYMNPNRIQEKYLPMFAEHNKKWYKLADMTISAMVLDWDQPTAKVKDAFRKFSPDGYATIVADMHGTGGKSPVPHMWKGMPVMNLSSNADFNYLEHAATMTYELLKDKPKDAPGFYMIRTIWVTPTQVMDALNLMQKNHPDVELKIVDPYTLFDLFKQAQDAHPSK